MYIKIKRQKPTAGASVFLGARSWQTTIPHNTYIHTRQLEPQCPSSKMTTRELAGWLAGFGWLAEAQRGPEWPREAQRGRAGIEQACHAFGWKLPRSRLTTREAPQRFLYVTQEEAPPGLLHTTVPNRNPLQTQGLPTSRMTSYQGGSPQAELRTGRQNYDQGTHPQASSSSSSSSSSPSTSSSSQFPPQAKAGHRQWRPFHIHTYIHTYAQTSQRFSGHLLWRLSFLFCHMYTTYVHMCVHMYIHIRLGAASGEAFIAFDFMASFLWAPPVATRFSVPS